MPIPDKADMSARDMWHAKRLQTGRFATVRSSHARGQTPVMAEKG